MQVGFQDREYDVAVIGAGPAGSSAAIAAVNGGARVLLLDRAKFPRYKTCGGGLIGATLGEIPAGLAVPVRQEIHRATFTLRGGQWRSRESQARVLSLTDRAEFDASLVELAQTLGADFSPDTTALDVVEESGLVLVQTNRGTVRARFVVGADGSASRVAKYVGVKVGQVDLGLELEIDAGPLRQEWDGRIHLDWGHLPGSYAWVFPKGDTLTVGVISRKGDGAATKDYLRRFVAEMRLDRSAVVKDSGHLTRCRTAGSPLGKGGVLVTGDAAGFLEPWTREGISFAIRSGRYAGESIVETLGAGAEGAPDQVQDRYARRVQTILEPEMRAGAQCLRAFEAHPGVFHRLIGGTEFGWTQFCRLTRGETTFARAVRHRSVRTAIGILGRGSPVELPADGVA